MARDKHKLKFGKGAAFVKGRLKALRQQDDSWEADYHALPKQLAQSETHYLGMVVTQPDGFLLADLPVEYTPDANDLATLLAHAMRRPLAEGSHRPRRIPVRKNPKWTPLFPHLKEIGVEVIAQSELPKVNEAFGNTCGGCAMIEPQMPRSRPLSRRRSRNCSRAIAKWVSGYGHIDIGDQESFDFIVRAIDYGGVVFEDDKPTGPLLWWCA